MGRLLTRAKFLGWLHAVGRIDDDASAGGSSKQRGIAKQKIAIKSYGQWLTTLGGID